MSTFRIISKIDIKEQSLVKGINLEGLRKLGDPYNFIKHYYLNNIDELVLHDVTASLYGNKCITEVIKVISENIFIPITVGGGIRTVKDVENILKAGGDRVLLNSGVVKNIKFLNEVVKNFGSSNVAVNIEYLNYPNCSKIYYEYGRQKTDIDLKDWIKKVQDHGAGEIVLTSIDREGTGLGFDTDTVKKIIKLIKIPLTIHGGCSSAEDIINLYKIGKISGVVVSSLFHYNYLKNNKEKKFNLEKWKNVDIKKIKHILKKKGIEIR